MNMLKLAATDGQKQTDRDRDRGGKDNFNITLQSFQF